MAAVFTSCENERIARTLEGTWQGNLYQEYEWGGAVYRPSYTEISFLRDPFSFKSGKGYWVDYFNGYHPWQSDYVANHTEWSVRNGVIWIYLVEDDVEFRISRYRLNDNFFSGEIAGDDGSLGEFSLRHVSSPNWNGYNDWGSGYAYYVNGTRGAEPSDSILLEKPVRITH